MDHRNRAHGTGSSGRDALSVARTVLEGLSALDADLVVSCFADDAEQEMPFAPAGFPDRREGIEAISQMYHALPAMARSIKFDVHNEWRMADPEWVLLEYDGKIEQADGSHYDNHYFGLFRVVDGKIKLFREIFDSVVLVQAFSEEAREKALSEIGGD
jgi:ketosteroid isomerase-like protein